MSEFIIILSIINSVIHEILHGLAYKLFGVKIRFEFKLPYAYTMETSGLPIDIFKFTIILLLPLLLISLTCLFLPTWLGEIFFIINLLGSAGYIHVTVSS
ncbi:MULTISPECIES: metalloprotease family protein [Clostridium]|nr:MULTISPECIES: metalloprotease family protein [Clostridium]AGY75394.1 metalloprotease family protein [Clostridium autoethanogenum DSM 10061]ALU35560.1 Hypothetical protein CLAU_1131 [Clostridium autoethanogenum DSM 10061]OAA89842.1 hypothetical protein WX45_01680 [Clostridium ljungdahlii DSM 13528]OVY52378.1 hypothetical protein WX72_01276 [Clostridium autoethanogenum]